MTNKNDSAWATLFKETKILSEISDNGFSSITADIMRKYREPRLMAKIDTIELLPNVFKSNELSILPIKNGEYIIFKDPQYQGFFNFPDDLDQIKVNQHIPAVSLSNFDSFQDSNNLSEAQALDTALMSSIIKTFTDEKNLWLTIRGRHFTKDFKVNIPYLQRYIDVSKVQIEIDAGYESENAIYILEAKIGKRGNFNIRQLLYPYLDWEKRTSKKVIPIFFFFTNGFYYLFKFDLGDSLDASKITKQACYTLYEIKGFNLNHIIENAVLDRSSGKDVPFPQANDLDKVIDTVSLVGQGYINKNDISEVLEFDERQGDYYANAARFIGFLDRVDNEFSLTNNGERLLRLGAPSKRADFIAEQLVMRPVFFEVFKQLYELGNNAELLDKIDINSFIEEYTNLTGSTPERRSSTVKHWIKWVYRYAL